MNAGRNHRLLLTLGLAGLALPGCGAEVEDRLLSIDAYHVEFQPSRGDLPPADRATEADAWRAQIRQVADRIVPTVSDANVWGDETLWEPILNATNARVTRCELSNNTIRALSLTPGQPGQIREAAIQASLLNSGPISGVGPCNTGAPNLIRAFDLGATSLTAGVPKSRVEPLDVHVGTTTSADPWTQLRFATLTVTNTSSSKGAAQFAFMVVEKKQGWLDNFEEVIIVTHGSYFGDI